MAKEYAKAFYASRAWHDCRASYIAERRAIDGGMCERCHEHPGYIVHHIKHLTPYNINDPMIALAHQNLELVCKDCHEQIHAEDDGKVLRMRTVVFDRNGEPMLADPP